MSTRRSAGVRPTLFGGHSGIRDALVIGLVTVGMVVAIEGAFRLLWPQRLQTTYVDDRPIGIPDERLGFRMSPNHRVIVRGPEFSVEYATDANGLRDVGGVSAAASADAVHLLALGDSFTFGAGNQDDHIWPVLFERQLTKAGHAVEVVNAGIPGYDTRTQALFLEQLLQSHDPDIVLLTFLPNDLFTNRPIGSDDLIEVTAGGATNRFAGKGSNLHSLIFAKRVVMASDWLYRRLYLMTARAEYFATPPSPHLQRQVSITKALLETIKELCDRNGAALVVLSVPQQFQVIMPAAGAGAADNIDPDWIDREFAAFAAARDITWLSALPDLRATYQAEGEDLYFRFDGHLNPQGNAALAEFLNAAFANELQGLLPQPRTSLAANPS